MKLFNRSEGRIAALMVICCTLATAGSALDFRIKHKVGIQDAPANKTVILEVENQFSDLIKKYTFKGYAGTPEYPNQLNYKVSFPARNERYYLYLYDIDEGEYTGAMNVYTD